MGRKKEPTVYKMIGVRPNGETPPELMSDEECYNYNYYEAVLAAIKIGGKPKPEADSLTHEYYNMVMDSIKRTGSPERPPDRFVPKPSKRLQDLTEQAKLKANG